MDTSGFYGFNGEQLSYAPTTVMFPIAISTPDLNRDQHDAYTYPVNGWYWFDSENGARGFFGLPLIEEKSPMVRARNELGQFVGDDPATPEDEAWVEAPAG